MNVRKMIKRKIAKIRCRFNAVQYAKSIGVKVGEGTRIYVPEIGMWSTEPWLISIGKNCHIAYGVRFITHDGGTLVIDPKEYESNPFVICGDIKIGDNVYIGERTTILPGVTIGDNVIIGCSSVVTKDIPENTVAAGAPCRVVNTKENYVKKIRDIISGNNSRYYSDLDYMHSLNPNRKLNR